MPFCLFISHNSESSLTMQNCGKLAGYTVFITGASRGIGKAVALKVARDGANVVVASKTSDPNPKLPGTIHTAAEEITQAGGRALPCVVDVRNEDDVKAAVDKTVEEFGGIDILVNNASAISLTNTKKTLMKTYDLMHDINSRGTYLCSKLCIPHLIESRKKGKNPHILNMSPPLSLNPQWFSMHCAYTMAKYGMSMCTLGMAAEFAEQGIAVNSLWPQTTIITAAVEMLAGGNKAISAVCRKPEIMSDATYAILIRDAKQCTGNFFVDEDVVREEGVSDMDQYAIDPSQPLVDIVNPGEGWKAVVDAYNQKS